MFLLIYEIYLIEKLNCVMRVAKNVYKYNLKNLCNVCYQLNNSERIW